MEKEILKLHQLLQQGLCCSAALVSLALSLRGEDNDQLVEAASGFCGGLRSGMICGALTGGCMCLSLYDSNLAVSEMIPELTEWFRETYGEAYGGTDCKDILAGNPVNKVLRCPDLVENVWKKVTEILEDQGLEVSAFQEE